MLRAESRRQCTKFERKRRAKSITIPSQQGSYPEPFNSSGQAPSNGSPLHMRTRTPTISALLALALSLVACCAPTTNTTTKALPETAFTATFLGFTSDGKNILVKPERSSTNIQLIYNTVIYDTAPNLTAGQRVYVLGKLEGNLVYVSELRKLN
jgi:hypothetical protein